MVGENCRRVLERIHEAAVRSGRDPAAVRLIAVTKTVAASKVREAAEAGITDIGENRLQEAVAKRTDLADLHLTWHFIGHLQTNKARKAVDVFDCIQSVDRLDLAEKLQQYAPRVLPVLIEVKLHDEATKSGITESELPEFVDRLKQFERLELRGLMAIPPFRENPEDTRAFFRRLRELGERFRLPELSMGMSHDFEVAISEGSTMVRVGTALFGERP